MHVLISCDIQVCCAHRTQCSMPLLFCCSICGTTVNQTKMRPKISPTFARPFRYSSPSESGRYCCSSTPLHVLSPMDRTAGHHPASSCAQYLLFRKVKYTYQSSIVSDVLERLVSLDESFAERTDDLQDLPLDTNSPWHGDSSDAASPALIPESRMVSSASSLVAMDAWDPRDAIPPVLVGDEDIIPSRSQRWHTVNMGICDGWV